MEDDVKLVLMKILISMHDMDEKTYNASLLIKQIPMKMLPLDVLEFFKTEIEERENRIKKLKDFTILVNEK